MFPIRCKNALSHEKLTNIFKEYKKLSLLEVNKTKKE